MRLGHGVKFSAALLLAAARLAFAQAESSASAPVEPGSVSVPASAPASAPEPAPVASAPAASAPASAPATTAAAAPAKPKEFVEPPPAAPTNCPAVTAADYGATAAIRDADFFPDGKQVVYLLAKGASVQLVVQPLAADDEDDAPPPARRFDKTGLDLRAVRVYPDGRRLLLQTRKAGGVPAWYRLDLAAKTPRPEALAAPDREAEQLFAARTAAAPFQVAAADGAALDWTPGAHEPGSLRYRAAGGGAPRVIAEVRTPAVAAVCDAEATPLPLLADTPLLSGWLYVPKKITAGAILLGDSPGAGFKPDFDGRINYLVSRGFLVLVSNRRGTACCGEEVEKADAFAADDEAAAVTGARAYLIANGVPENRVVLWGEGTGGTLALRVMEAAPREYAAGVLAGAPTDLPAWRAALPEGELRARLLATLGENGLARKRSPLSGSLDALPPLIVLHGGDDDLVPAEQSERLVEALLASGRIVAFHRFDGAGHALDRPLDRANALSSVGKFLRRHVLMKAPPKKTAAH